MPRVRRTLTAAASFVVALSLVAAASACSRSYDTTQVDTEGKKQKSSASSTSIAVETVPPSTTIDFDAIEKKRAASLDLGSTLSALVSSFALDPELLAQIQTLASGDLAGIAKMFNIDLSALNQLGMTVKEIEALGESVAENIELVQKQLADAAGAAAGAALGGLAGSAPIDPGVLVGLLTNSVDVGGLANGAIASLVQSLADAISENQIQISADTTGFLNDLLTELDPNGLGQLTTDPQNASFIALITSVLLSTNPSLSENLLENPLLDPGLKNLLADLGQLNASLGDGASAAILAALKALFPDLAI